MLSNTADTVRDAFYTGESTVTLEVLVSVCTDHHRPLPTSELTANESRATGPTKRVYEYEQVPHHPIDLLYNWITSGWCEKQNAVRNRSEHHCNLLQSLLRASFQEHPSWWEASPFEAEKWSRLLVGCGYPWFLCSLFWKEGLWRRECESALIASASGCEWCACALLSADPTHIRRLKPEPHLHIMHQLLRHGILKDVWTICDHLKSDVPHCYLSTFYRTMCQPRWKSFYKQWATKTLHTYPFGNPECEKMTKAMLKGGAWKCLVALAHHCAEEHKHPTWLTDEMVQRTFAESDFPMAKCMMQCKLRAMDTTAKTSFVFWAAQFTYLLSAETHYGKLSHSNNGTFYKKVLLLRDMCLQHLSPSGWCHMLVHWFSSHQTESFCVLSRLMCNTTSSRSVLHLFDSTTRRCIEKVPPGLVSKSIVLPGVIRKVNWDEVCERGADWWFRIANRELVTLRRWSLFANAIRWGDVGVVDWCILKGCSARDIVQCRSTRTMARDNPITLAISNRDNRVLQRILRALDQNSIDSKTGRLDARLVHRWFEEDQCFTLATALGRICHTRHRHALNKFRAVFQYAPEAILRHKGVLVAQLLHTWSTRAERHPCLATCPANCMPSRVWNHPVIRMLLELPSPIRGAHLPAVFVGNTHMLQTMTPRDCAALVGRLFCSYGMVRAHELVHELSATSPLAFGDDLLVSVVTHPHVSNSMRGLLSSTQRNAIVMSWAGRHIQTLLKLLRVARDDWQWMTRHTLPAEYPLYYEHTPAQLPKRIRNLYKLTRNNSTNTRLPPVWDTLLREGMVPLVFNSTELPGNLSTHLKAYRLIRRALQRWTHHKRQLQDFRHHQCCVLIESGAK